VIYSVPDIYRVLVEAVEKDNLKQPLDRLTDQQDKVKLRHTFPVHS